MSESSLDRKDDIEKSAHVYPVAPVLLDKSVAVADYDDGVNRSSGFIGKLWDVVRWLDKFGVEARGVERVHEDERHHTKLSDAGTMWFSANMTVSTFALGALGNSIWYLGLSEAILIIVFFNLLCTLPVALFSVWGKETGLRQMILGRFSFGKYAIWFPVVLNGIACIGWTIINTIAGSSVLNEVSDKHSLPVWAGCLIIAVSTLFIASFGYKYVHHFERYASIPVFIIFLIVLGCSANNMKLGFGGSGSLEAAGCLSFGGAIAGFALGWTSLAADYVVHVPKQASNTKIFLYTYAGLNFPLILVESIGAGVRSTFTDPSDSPSTGEMIKSALAPLNGFGRFLMVILALSIVANNIPNLYSFGLTVGSLGKWAQSIPRIFLSIFGTAIAIALSIVGHDHFETALDTLLLVLAYWLAIYTVVLIEEHYIFRRGNWANYDLEETWNNFSLLPPGFAAWGAILCGVMGAVLGMSQTWYAGKAALAISQPFGGDIGFELSGACAAVIYPILRYFERRHFGR